ncbi:DoxX family protein [uncultured Chitinophaga sp.]|jgi:Predicted membrane protein|uniref:DoxX family protein n=1 Tax=uncultured Chitinophaga sp. TaxID=339340 RepID=UPI002628FBAB|nr:DoxX family protein [uncultured Chitinophaga sp.]
MKVAVLLGRVLFSLIFLFTIPGHFSPQLIGYAAAQGVPAPSFLVPLSGIIAFAGGLSIVFGYKAKLGAWLIIIFLVPVTLFMHAFWKITDPVAQQMDMVMFMKNVGLTGAALMITYFGAGPLSVDEKMAGNRK